VDQHGGPEGKKRNDVRADAGGRSAFRILDVAGSLSVSEGFSWSGLGQGADGGPTFTAEPGSIASATCSSGTAKVRFEGSWTAGACRRAALTRIARG
jgi:hypothetical protein